MRFWIALLLVPVAFGQTLDTAIDHLFAVKRFKEVAISPDGARVAWVAEAADPTKTEVYVAPNTRLGEGHGIVWSPDSAQIAYISEGQVYVAHANGKPRKLTNLSGYVSDLRWSPDGRRIALLYTAGGGSFAGPLEATPARTGLIDEQIQNARITTLDVGSGKFREVSPADLNIYEFDWSPDGSRFVATAAPGPGDNNWWTAQLYIVEGASGRMRSIYKPSLQIALPRWSPDGKTIAFIGGLMSDEGFVGGDIFTLPVAGGAPRNRTANRKSSPNGIEWTSAGQILVTEYVGGGSSICRLDPASGQIAAIWSAEDEAYHGANFANISVSRDGSRAAIIRSNWQRPPEIWAGAPGTWQQITHENAKVRPDWGQARSIRWTNDGLDVQGWLLYPANYSPQRKYPVVVYVHGGPASIRVPRWPEATYDGSVFAGGGYFVFFPNPRGSYGQGEAFTRANVKDFGGGDLRDILAGLDVAARVAPIDLNRAAITGWSYGGFMTMFAVTQTQRFRAAVAGAGIANWQSYYGENSIDQWMIPYFGASVYDDPAVYAKTSAINFIKRVKTPTLVVVGERDGECPAPQSYEFWHALKTLSVPTELVVYAGEGHMFRKPEHERDVIRRAAAWFDRYLK